MFPQAPGSFTLRTDTPASYISIGASSTDASRRRYRSTIAVSNGNVRSFGTFDVIYAAFVSRDQCLLAYPAILHLLLRTPLF
jgi:hypothetical protein